MSSVSEAKNCNPTNADLFFDGRFNKRAVELCLNCPKMIGCAQGAREEGHIYGVWGAETAEERCAWLVDNHPDPEVRDAAQVEVDYYRNKRASNRKTRMRAANPAAVTPSRSVQFRAIRRLGSTTRKKRADVLAAKARRMQAASVPVPDIARELSVSTRSVERYLSARYDDISV